MANEGDEQWNVVKKVLVGNGKFREYRLPKSLSTDRSPLWRTKYEVGRKIGEVLKRKKAHIAELRRSIKKIEQSQTKWLTLAKSVNQHNENFFLDALNGTDEELEKFENENFFSNHSWAKHRDVGELTKEEMDEMTAGSAEEATFDVAPENGLEKSAHYEWMCEKTNGLSTSKIENAEPIDSKSDLSESEKLVGTSNVAKKNEVEEDCSNEKISNTLEMKEETVSEIVVDHSVNATKVVEVESITQEVKTETTLENASLSVVQNETEDVARPDTIVEESKKEPETQKDLIGNEEKSENVCKDIPSPLTEDSSETSSLTDTQSLSNASETTDTTETTCSNLVGETDIKKLENGDDKKHSGETANQKRKNKSKETCQTSTEKSSPTVTKKPIVQLDGISRLRLTPASSTSNVPPPQPAAPIKKHGSIWEQKAAEREEKLLDEKKKEDQQDVSASPKNAKSNNNNKNTANPTRDNAPNGNTSKKPVKNSNKDTHKPADTNGWITFSAKNGSRPKNSTFLNDLKKQEAIAAALKLQEDDKTGSSSKQEAPSVVPAAKPVLQESQPTKISKEQVKQGGDKEKSTAEEKPSVGSLSEQEAEKRAKRRRRVQEKAKLIAQKNKEEEKQARKRKQAEQERKIQTEKKEKEAKHREEFEKKQEEIKKARAEREMKRRGKYEEAKRISEMLKSKERLAAHLIDKSIVYRQIGARIYLATRIPQIAEDLRLDISISKHNILQKFKNRLDALGEINKFLCFVSVQLMARRNPFKIEELLEYMPVVQKNADTESEEAQKVANLYKKFRETLTLPEPEIMLKATNFADLILRRIVKLENRDAETDRTQEILENYKVLYNEAVNFMGVTSYLHTRKDTEFFIVEEDYLLTITESDNSGYQGENRSENETEDDGEYVKVHDMSCQTEGDPYDVRAASFLPKED